MGNFDKKTFMNNNFTIKLISILFLSVIIFITSCSKKTDDSNGSNSTPTKTLNKSTLTPKKWYSQGSAFVHDLKAGGIYGTMGGTWQWKNNSDTLQIVTQSGYPDTFWKVYWNTSNEMECEKVGTFTKLLYKDIAW
jgi:hypothetical protein